MDDSRVVAISASLNLRSGQIRWKCATTEETEGGILDPFTRVIPPDRGHLFEEDFQVETDFDRWQYSNIWKRIVSEYTQRELGFSGDKFNTLD